LRLSVFFVKIDIFLSIILLIIQSTILSIYISRFIYQCHISKLFQSYDASAALDDQSLEIIIIMLFSVYFTYLCTGGQRLFSKKFAVTSRLVVSSRAWMRTIPTRNCDVLITFPTNVEDDTLMWILARLRMRVPELCVHVRHHGNTKIYGFYLTASYEKLVQIVLFSTQLFFVDLT